MEARLGPALAALPAAMAEAARARGRKILETRIVEEGMDSKLGTEKGNTWEESGRLALLYTTLLMLSPLWAARTIEILMRGPLIVGIDLPFVFFSCGLRPIVRAESVGTGWLNRRYAAATRCPDLIAFLGGLDCAFTSTDGVLIVQTAQKPNSAHGLARLPQVPADPSVLSLHERDPNLDAHPHPVPQIWVHDLRRP